MIMSKILMFVIAVVLMFAPWVEGATYKWVDNEGRVHLSDIPPSQKNVEVIQQSRVPPPDGKAQQRLESLMQSQQEAREVQQHKKEERKQQAAEKKARAEGCRRAQERRSRLESRPARRTIIISDEGQRTRMTEEDLKVQVTALKKQIADLCGK